MCKLEGTLKFCTCNAKEAARLEQSWVFYRFNAEKHQRLRGRVAVPDRLHPQVDAANRRLLLARLQEDDAFDVDLEPAEGDRLAITLRCAESDKAGKEVRKLVTYGYERKAGRWVEEPFHGLGWQWHHDEVGVGKLRRVT